MTANPTALRATRIGSFSETSFNITASAIIINIIENHLITGSDLYKIQEIYVSKTSLKPLGEQ